MPELTLPAHLEGNSGEVDCPARLLVWAFPAITRLQAEYNRLQGRVDAMYVDKLDGRIDAAFFDRKSSEWRCEQDLLLRSIEEHQAANQTYLEEGIRLLELTRRAHNLFQKQEPREKPR